MKEIHAYQNNGGTYRVEITDTIEEISVHNHSTHKKTTSCKSIIDRAIVKVTALNSLDNDGKEYIIVC